MKGAGIEPDKSTYAAIADVAHKAGGAKDLQVGMSEPIQLDLSLSCYRIVLIYPLRGHCTVATFRIYSSVCLEPALVVLILIIDFLIRRLSLIC